MQSIIQTHWQRLVSRFPQWEQAEASFTQTVQLLADCVARRNKILLCGNGGSAADAEHIAGELMKSFVLARPLPQEFLQRIESTYPDHKNTLSALECGIAAISLVSGVALPTAFANDVNGELCFAQQVYALARPGDVLLGISTSGNSANVNHALRVARLLACATVGLTGRTGGEMSALLDVELRAPSSITAHVQELHLPMYHALCACLEECIFGNPETGCPPSTCGATVHGHGMAAQAKQTWQATQPPLTQDKGSMAALPPRVELLVFDFDGVFTDNLVRVDQHGNEAVFCSRGDSLGIDMLRAERVPMLILSTETNPVVSARAGKLRIPVEQGCGNKAAFLAAYMQQQGIDPQNVVYMGNDVNDLAAMRLVGCVAAPGDAHPAVLNIAHVVTTAPGGRGAVREVCEGICARLKRPD
ncbi:SIS domain-containing protein [Desulfovibrio sp.]|uniref:SIS domain-containing protein n=1 Tax=Desulfovibrio sp. TaxID=885 RepID=UPI0025BFFD00|nr:SIS domain-containing protein [Desulfovibrio sp.]